MKLLEVFRYELEYRRRSITTWLYAGFLMLFAIWSFLATAEGNGYVNSPERVAGGSLVVSIIGILITAAIFGETATRDYASDMDSLIFTSGISKREYLGGRFLAALAVNAIVALAIPIGLVIATMMVGSFQSSVTGPYRVLAYVEPYVVFVLPDLALSGAILYAVGVRVRHVVPVYLSGLLLFIGYLVSLNTFENVANPVLSLITDPMGMRALQTATRYWTEAERNVRLIGLPSEIVWDRVVWLAVAAAIFAFSYRRFRFAHASGVGVSLRRRRQLSQTADVRVESRPIVTVPRVTGAFGPKTTLRQVFGLARESLAEVMASWWFIGVLIGSIVATVGVGWNVGRTVFDAPTWPVTLLIGGSVLSQRVLPVICALIALYAGELVWADRDSDMAEVADAAPVSNAAALLGRFIALFVLIVLFQAAMMLGGLLIQVLQGYHRFELGVYLKMVFGLNLATYLLFAVGALVIQVLVNHKYVAHMVLLLATITIFSLPRLGVVRHHLLLYNTTPGWTYSDMNGVAPFLRAFIWFKLYWAAWALLLGMLAVLFWVRGREPGLRHRLAQARARYAGSVARASLVAVGFVLILGGFVFYNTNILNEYRSADDRAAAQAQYEQRYARFADIAQPTLTDVSLREEIYPDRPAAELRGSYVLVNRTKTAIDSVHVYEDPTLETDAMALDKSARLVLADARLGYRIFQLEQPLQPGDSIRLTFALGFRPRGFRNGEGQTNVAAGASYFDRRWLPFIGYQPVFELTDDATRKRFGLAAHPLMPSRDDTAALQHRWAVRGEDLVNVDAVVGTALDQIAITPGVLRKSWTENGHRYFHYQSEQPIAFGNAVFSSNYAVRESRWHDVALQVFYHPGHGYDVDQMMRSMKASLDYYTSHFGPYPYGVLRIVEYPRYGGFGSAHPTIIAFAEDAFLTRVTPGELDQTFFGTAHETAHSWWGGMVRGAVVRGDEFLSESLANYSAMLVVEHTIGPEAGRRVYDFQMQRYLLGRASQSHEVPLLDDEGQPYISYRKGAIAMYTLHDFLGADSVDTALRRYFEKFDHDARPYPTSRDLYSQLRAITPDSLQSLLTNWFETVTLWDVKTTRADVQPSGNGDFRVSLTVVAKKMRADSVGHTHAVPMDDYVEVGAFTSDKGDLGAPLYLKRQRIRSGEQTIAFTVPVRPARAGVDPYHKLIERQRDDNLAALPSTTNTAHSRKH